MALDDRDQAQIDLVNGLLLQLMQLLLIKGFAAGGDWVAATDAALAPLLKPGDADTVTLLGRAVPDSRQAAYSQAARNAYRRLRHSAAIALGLPDVDDSED